ncbi:MAG: hypothetical protein ACYTHK_20600 [Planctomycetota bacterium]|jgi:hypothetical protein
MDPALAVVQGYLHLNGYFTVLDYPVMESIPDGYRSATDLDVLAVRLPGAGHQVIDRDHPRTTRSVDPELGVNEDGLDLIIGEVKQGVAELNRGARDPAVLAAVISRFGAVPPDDTDRIVRSLLDTGVAQYRNARLRMVAFGTHAKEGVERPYQTITLGHVIESIESFLDRRWEIVRNVYSSHPAMGLLMLLEKVRRRSGPKG